jgi:hypothetical protein
MKSVSLKMTMIISACILLASIIVQAADDSKNTLQGKWALENVSAFDGAKQKPFSTDNLNFEIPAEINIRQDEIALVRKDRVEEVKFDAIVRGDNLCFFVCARWSVAEDTLQLQWEQDASESEPGLNIVITYSRQ